MKKLQKREKILLGGVLAAVLAGLYLTMGSGESLETINLLSGQLNTAEAEYVSDLNMLIEAQQINSRYEKIADQLHSGKGSARAGLQFTEELNGLCRSLGLTDPRLEPASSEEIQGVEDYELVTVRLRIEGPMETIVKVIKDFEAKRLLFQEVDLRGAMDNDNVNAAITVARIAKVSPEEIQARKTRKKPKAKKSNSVDEF